MHKWPPNSPNLSPIEHIWSYIKQKLSDNNEITTRNQLEDTIRQIWNNISMDYINKLVLSFKNRLEMCQQIGGKTISHFVSAGKHEIPIKYQELKEPINIDIQRKFFEKYRTMGRK